ncbi:MAG: glutamine--tRNA ligase, partial [Selenomonas sp.]|nr:glutamine--tRNA ligase [Selenomonas sp.]
EEIGVAKGNSLVDVAMLESCVRADLNENADRIMAVLRPLKVVITNYPEDKEEWLLGDNNPMHGGHRFIPFSRELYIEQEDFMEEAPKKFFRLKPGGEVRLKHAYIIKCDEVIKDEAGNVVELHCTADLESKTGGATASRKIKGTIHWVAAKTAVPAEVRLYDYLLETDENGNLPADFIGALNKNSLEVIDNAWVEPSVKLQAAGKHYQFLRTGYFVIDTDTTPDKLVFNRVVGLRDSWAKEKNK